MLPRITGLNVYPVKSLGGVRLDEAMTSTTGLEHDREYFLTIEENGEVAPLTQREAPGLATFAVSLAESNIGITSRAGGHISIEHELAPTGSIERVVLFDKPGFAAEVSRDYSGFFTDELDIGRPVKLRKTVSFGFRRVKKGTESNDPGALNVTNYADGYPVLLASESSLAAVNDKIINLGGEPVPMNRFRPNVVIDTVYTADGEPQAFAEDYVKKVYIERELSMRAVRACSRCVIVTTDQEKGVKTGPIVNQALAAVHSGIDPVNGKRGLFFGQNMVHDAVAKQIRVGDELTSVLLADEPNIRFK